MSLMKFLNLLRLAVDENSFPASRNNSRRLCAARRARTEVRDRSKLLSQREDEDPFMVTGELIQPPSLRPSATRKMPGTPQKPSED